VKRFVYRHQHCVVNDFGLDALVKSAPGRQIETAQDFLKWKSDLFQALNPGDVTFTFYVHYNFTHIYIYYCYIVIYLMIYIYIYHCIYNLYSLPIHLSPILASNLAGGVRLFGCLFFAFTSLSSFVSCNSPNLSVSQLFCLQSSVCLSGRVRLFRHHFSPTICLLLDLSPKSFVSNHMSALVAVSCSSFIMFSFVFRVCLCCSNPFVSSCCLKINHVAPGFLCVLSLVSHLSPSYSYCLRYKWRGKKSKPRGMRLMLFSIDQTLPASGTSITTNMRTNAAMDLE